MENIYSRGAVENTKAIYFSTKIAFNVGRELFPFSFPPFCFIHEWQNRKSKRNTKMDTPMDRFLRGHRLPVRWVKYAEENHGIVIRL